MSQDRSLWPQEDLLWSKASAEVRREYLRRYRYRDVAKAAYLRDAQPPRGETE